MKCRETFIQMSSLVMWLYLYAPVVGIARMNLASVSLQWTAAGYLAIWFGARLYEIKGKRMERERA